MLLDPPGDFLPPAVAETTVGDRSKKKNLMLPYKETKRFEIAYP
jgi:hypothetical protein